MHTTPQYLNEYAVGDMFSNHLAVSNATRATASNGSDYLRVTLSDQSGTVTAMLWDVSDGNPVIDAFKPGNIVFITGNIGEYQTARQMNIHNYRVETDLDAVDMRRLVKTAPIDTESTLLSLGHRVRQMENDVIKSITGHILERYDARFMRMPAAKAVHHAYQGGLIYHTESMRKHGDLLCDLHPELNRDLLIAGIILHDIGKTIEYTDGIVTEKTLAGELKGHISIMSEIINEAAHRLGYATGSDAEQETVLLLQHMILSHHGLASNGWGSPVSPLIIEAEVLHRIDMFDAHLESYRDAAEKVDPGEYTNRIFGLNNRSFYKHKL